MRGPPIKRVVSPRWPFPSRKSCRVGDPPFEEVVLRARLSRRGIRVRGASVEGALSHARLYRRRSGVACAALPSRESRGKRGAPVEEVV